jgi:plasmid stabilization system protein ParE
MGVSVRWSPQSREHLAGIRAYIRQQDADAAERVRRQIALRQILKTVKLLRWLPRFGHPGRRHGTREFLFPGLPYIIVYRADIGDRDEVVILGIFHGAQER